MGWQPATAEVNRPLYFIQQQPRQGQEQDEQGLELEPELELGLGL